MTKSFPLCVKYVYALKGLDFAADTSIFGFREGEESADKRTEKRLQSNINEQLDKYLDTYQRQHNVIFEAEQEESDTETEKDERRPKPRKKTTKVEEKTTLEER